MKVIIITLTLNLSELDKHKFNALKIDLTMRIYSKTYVKLLLNIYLLSQKSSWVHHRNLQCINPCSFSLHTWSHIYQAHRDALEVFSKTTQGKDISAW